MGVEDGLLLGGGQLDLAFLAGFDEGFGLWGVGQWNFGDGLGVWVGWCWRRRGDLNGLWEVHGRGEERGELLRRLGLGVLLL